MTIISILFIMFKANIIFAHSLSCQAGAGGYISENADISVTANFAGSNLYDIENLTTIELIFEAPNWNEILDQYYADGNEERLLATAFINGEQFDSVGVRYKGSSTYYADDAKKPLNIKLDYVTKQDYQGFEELKLANGKHDPSFVREVLSYEIARKYMVAPLSNYAKVYINDQYYGLFSNSEAINGDFGQRSLFADGNNTRFKSNSDIVGPGGESSLEYYGEDPTLYYNHYELKSDNGWEDLVELTDVLNNQTENIETILNVDRTLWMLAFNNVLVNLDSYSGRKGNYYLIKDDNGIFNIILWDLNLSLGGYETIGGGLPGHGNLSDLVELSPLQEADNPAYPLINKLMENDTYKRMYIAHCRTIVEENLANGWYETRGLELQAIITDAYLDDPGAFYPYTSFIDNMTSSVPGTGGPPTDGAKPSFGITELFGPRVIFLQNHAEFQHPTPIIENINTSPESVPEFTSVTITTETGNSHTVLLGYRHTLSDEFVKTTMFDDGNHNDGLMGDGIYGAAITARATDIQYYIYAENDNAGIFAPERAEHDFFEVEVNAVIVDIVLNEFMADNDATITDPAGEFEDWIELYNNTSETISLEGWFLSDDTDDPAQWTFPDVSIAPNDYLIIWADNDEGQQGLHANFKLSKNGEAIILSNSQGSMVDQITFGAQETDKSTGRYPNGTGDFTQMCPTFNDENKISILGDFDRDCDVDGKDLSDISQVLEIGLSEFAKSFGRVGCNWYCWEMNYWYTMYISSHSCAHSGITGLIGSRPIKKKQPQFRWTQFSTPIEGY